jgi:hypothetical protein
MASERILSIEEEKAVEALARRRGFSELREYVRSLIEADAQEHGEELSLAEDEGDELDDPAESLRRGWEDAMNGRTMSREEFRRRMMSDAD